MRFTWKILVCLTSWPSAWALYNQSTGFPQEDVDNGVALQEIANQALGEMEQESLTSNGCRLEEARVRKEWRDLSFDARKEFTDAIMCLQSLPANISAEVKETFQGVQSRYDEFVATHINLTEYIHVTVSLDSWNEATCHRFFIHAFENALKIECNYTGTLPYWEWGYDAENPQDSVLFNGDPYSMGANGKDLNQTSLYWASRNLSIPAGTGGGCVYAGPFSNYTVDMGPIDAPGQQPVQYDLEYNPRCLSRDVNPTVSKESVAFRNTTKLILSYDTIDWFQGVMQADQRFKDPTAPQSFGVHGGGHLTVGGVLADINTSPAESMFWLHHAQIDRIWTIWQGLDPANRRNAIWGTHTRSNDPPSANMTLDEMIDFGFISQPLQFADLMSPLSGPFCYYYA
ncbi:Di-copper centre-containing protein [Aspergillus sclerotiicarbonarius CBS 121057]|uniref:Di-copper centre-containing protein n=1 Tax=Aspergillus sclerotiicarbonarius (strain CBS 121057 / IBT 28362) TaxID=1448318 RepID=A0A319FJL1_ASPSB|nr:Di-copper centre-containing protein [Aspergillus sclerotiicarbonarius CBS 121057]